MGFQNCDLPSETASCDHKTQGFKNPARETERQEENTPRSGPQKERRDAGETSSRVSAADGLLGGRALCSAMPLLWDSSSPTPELYLGGKLTLAFGGVTQHPSPQPKYSMAK